MKHVRKYDAKKRKLAESSSPSVSYEENKPKAARKTSEINRRDFWKEVPNVSSIAPEVHSDHILALRKETGLSKPDQRKLRELMKSTYELRRKNILGSVILIKEIIGEYPPLSTCAGVSISKIIIFMMRVKYTIQPFIHWRRVLDLSRSIRLCE